ncbi:hypothetical protein K450DRAFT_292156 [Umbelopsis ramanniana AG]|uniref:NodB homology domain-containing protein n=1 Tax=Umbelopsis ramanniana AG TaxID=1314678 RepID=A0AAD5E301_UMBRA|nr:uncharacterized protein K450DRAFT_292156 [Umbelopsis ramanniana AG]KAI8575902.1 hypothetical protein K450DRAFT_292156 [Umbelopsis ramanniana AG]
MSDISNEIGSLTLPVWNHPTGIAGGPVPQVTACANSGNIAVTYNEGPSDVTAKVLNGLKNSQAKANFFVNATWLYTQQYAMMLQRAYNDGHFIGMTYRVPSDNPSAMTDAQIIQDITNTAKIIQTLIGVSPKYVRLHYSSTPDTRTERILSDLGFTLVGYNLDTMDYKFKENPAGVADLYKTTFAKQLETYDSKGSFISVQYDIPDTGSYLAINDVIKTIHDNGYTMVRLDGCLNDKSPYKTAADAKTFVGDKFSFGTAGYKQGQTPSSADTSEVSTTVEGESKKTSSSSTITGSMALISLTSLAAFVFGRL